MELMNIKRGDGPGQNAEAVMLLANAIAKASPRPKLLLPRLTWFTRRCPDDRYHGERPGGITGVKGNPVVGQREPR